METSHPKFKRPPVIETVLGVQYRRIVGLTNAHLGAFWTSLKDGWPHVADVPPLPEQIETFDRQLMFALSGLRLGIGQVPVSRLQMKNKEGDRMLQAQNCRLDYNWLGQAKGEYPGYIKIKPEFDKYHRKFLQFLSGFGFDAPDANQWEVTYVNHLAKDTIWKTPADWPSLFTGLLGLPNTSGAVSFESFGGSWHFEIPPKKGRLHMEIQHGAVPTIENKDEESLIVKLTARGPIEKGLPMLEAVDTGLATGHDAIGRTFGNLTSKTAHDFWEREQ